MCGIAAIINYAPGQEPVDAGELRRMTDSMSRRGPDGEGFWFSPGRSAGLGHRRLSIIDLSEHGTQPLTIFNERYAITFNGEIYNYRELRAQLAAEGASFHSHSDTEVLLHLYARDGERMLSRLRGMFAFCIWDNERRSAFCARDPYGIKPLYYSIDGTTIRLASQVKAILAGGCVSRAVDPAGKAGFYLTGSVPEPFTFYSAVKALPAGSWIKIENGTVAGPVQWFSIPAVFAEAGKHPDDAGESGYFPLVRESLLESVRYHMEADVPVGAFLSAGIDSTSLVGLMRDAGVEDIRTITLAFDEFRGKDADEAPLAGEVAQLYNTSHRLRYLASEEFRNDVPDVLVSMDQPSIDGINTYFVSKAAAEGGLKVVLSGLGSDELFAGYNTFDDVPSWVSRFRLPASIPFAGKAFREAYRLFIAGSSSRSPKVAGALEYGGSYAGAYYLRRGVFMPWELPEVMPKDEAEEGLGRLELLDRMNASLEPDPGTPYSRVAALEASWYMRNQLLRDTDWAGMAHSLEVRVPFVDAALLQRLAPALVRYAAQYKKAPVMESPLVPLPERVRKKPKTGFFVPIPNWLETETSIGLWRGNPSLVKDNTPWARRWAYTLVTIAEQTQ